MKRVKSAIFALAAILGIGGSVAASSGVINYTYTATTGGSLYQYNESYSSSLCIAGTGFCSMTCPIKYTIPQTSGVIVAAGGHGYGAGEGYGY